MQELCRPRRDSRLRGHVLLGPESRAGVALRAGTRRAAGGRRGSAGGPGEGRVGAEGGGRPGARGPAAPGRPQLHSAHALGELQRAHGLAQVLGPRGDLRGSGAGGRAPSGRGASDPPAAPRPPPPPTCSSSTAVAPGPSAGCSRRVSCESRKGTCGRRARSAAITPPRASSERLMVRASRRRWAPSRSPRDGPAAPAFQARSDPARSTRCRVPAGGERARREGALVSGAAGPHDPRGSGARFGTCGAWPARWGRRAQGQRDQGMRPRAVRVLGGGGGGPVAPPQAQHLEGGAIGPAQLQGLRP